MDNERVTESAHLLLTDDKASNRALLRSLFEGAQAAVLVVGMLLNVACTSGGGSYGAPVEERSTYGEAAPTRHAASVEDPSATATGPAGVEEAEWEARVRPLGTSGTTSSQPLASSTSPAPEAVAEPVVQPARAPATPQVAGASESVNPAVVSLLNTATAQSRAGEHARAAATLERAISIEPNNPWLWHRLADTRLQEGRLDQAASLASKSNSFAVGDRRLQADNWMLIAEVRRRQGEQAAAAAAESQAKSLLRQ